MEYRKLGRSGLRVSALSFGSWLTFGKQVNDDTAERCMKLAYDNGINFFDNAEAYMRGKSEAIMGSILKKYNWPRDTWMVSSKVYWGGDLPNQKGLSRKHVFEACHAALRRLQVEYLDLYFCHRPDRDTPIDETVWTMHSLVMQGKVLYWGTSEWSAEEIRHAHGLAMQHNLVPPLMEQPQYNMFHRERFEKEYARLYSDPGLGTTIWSPLASGLLTGKYNDGFPQGTRLGIQGLEWLKEKTLTEDRLDKVRRLSGLAKELDTTMPRLAIAWCLKNPNVSTVILGASVPEQIEHNLGALEVQQKLTPEVMGEIEGILANKPELAAF